MEEKEIHLRDYLRIINKRRFTVATFFIITFIIALIATFTATPQYRAASKVLLEKNQENPLSRRYYYSSYDPEFLATQYQIIKGQRVVRKVVDILKLEKNTPEFFQKKTQPALLNLFTEWIEPARDFLIKTLSSLAPAQNAPTKDKTFPPMEKADIIASIISSRIQVTPIKESRVVEISFISPNPALSQQIVNSVAKAYQNETLEIKMNSSAIALKWMKEKAEEERLKLDQSEQKLQKYMKANDIVTVENKITVVPQKLADVGRQLTETETKRQELEATYAQIKKISLKSDKAENLPVIADNPAIQALRQQIQKAEQTIVELSKKYGPKHPAMIKAKDELKGLKNKKTTEIKRVADSVQNEYQLLLSQEKNLHNLLDTTKNQAQHLNEKFIQYNLLHREVESNRVLYDALVTKLKEQSVTEQTASVNVWVVEKANLPMRPAKPNKKLNIFLAFFLGLGGGIGLAFFIEYLDNTIKSPDEAEEKLGLSVLGIIPKLRKKEKNIEFLVTKDSYSAIAESYKGIRTSLLLSSADHPPRSILVTSMSQSEGKTMTAVSLALTIGQSDLNVLLIDCDLRKPRIHKVFSLHPSKGLSTFLAGASDMDVAITSQEHNLTIIPAGPIPPNPSELLSSSKFKELLSFYQEQYDIVILDSPPLLPVTDSSIISQHADGTLIVSRSGQTTFEFLEKGIKILRERKARPLGIVINAADTTKGHYYYYGYSGYYSYSADQKA